MKPEKVFKRYDIRGKHPGEIDAEFARLLGRSFGSFLDRRDRNTVAVSRDTKLESEDLKDDLIRGLKESGVRCLDAAEGPTDYTAFCAVEKEVYGVQVTSSHLPMDHNGFKFIYPEGNGLMNPDLDEIRETFRQRDFIDGKSSEPENISEEMSSKYLEAAENYVRNVAGSVDERVEVEIMKGAGSVFLPELLERLGAEVEFNDSEIDPPKPEPEKLTHLGGKAVANDMDADRVAYRNEEGWFDGNQIAAALAMYLKPENVVASIDTSRAVGESCSATMHYTRVGDPFVISEAIEKDAELAVEPNGHYCFPDFVPYNSGTVAAAMMLAIDPSQEDIPRFHQLRESYRTENPDKTVRKIKNHVSGAYRITSEIDGVQYETEDTRVLVRPSGTSPKVRVVVDSDLESSAIEALQEVERIIQNG